MYFANAFSTLSFLKKGANNYAKKNSRLSILLLFISQLHNINTSCSKFNKIEEEKTTLVEQDYLNELVKEIDEILTEIFTVLKEAIDEKIRATNHSIKHRDVDIDTLLVEVNNVIKNLLCKNIKEKTCEKEVYPTKESISPNTSKYRFDLFLYTTKDLERFIKQLREKLSPFFTEKFDSFKTHYTIVGQIEEKELSNLKKLMIVSAYFCWLDKLMCKLSENHSEYKVAEYVEELKDLEHVEYKKEPEKSILYEEAEVSNISLQQSQEQQQHDFMDRHSNRLFIFTLIALIGVMTIHLIFNQ